MIAHESASAAGSDRPSPAPPAAPPRAAPGGSILAQARRLAPSPPPPRAAPDWSPRQGVVGLEPAAWKGAGELRSGPGSPVPPRRRRRRLQALRWRPAAHGQGVGRPPVNPESRQGAAGSARGGGFRPEEPWAAPRRRRLRRARRASSGRVPTTHTHCNFWLGGPAAGGT